ncbi:MAG: hypothetical protein V7722_05905 [Porticoccus sp.]
MASKRGLTIYFTDGNKASFDFPEQMNPSTVTKQTEDLLKGQYIMIEADGVLFLYPLYNIKSIQIYPAPKILPTNVVRNARLLS